MPEQISIGANFQKLFASQNTAVKGFGNIEDAIIKTAKVGNEFELIKDKGTGKLLVRRLKDAKGQLVILNKEGKEMNVSFQKVEGRWETISSTIKESVTGAEQFAKLTNTISTSSGKSGASDRASKKQLEIAAANEKLAKDQEDRDKKAGSIVERSQKKKQAGIQETLKVQKAAADELRRAEEAADKENASRDKANAKKAKQDGLATERAVASEKKKHDKASQARQKKINQEIERARAIWKGLLKLQISNQVSRAFGNVVTELRESVSLAGELSKSVAQISTIDVSGTGLSQINEDVVALSNQTGLDILDVASAQYQALSNQVVNAGNSFEFLQTANQLAIATLSTSEQSVNLLSSTINAFQLSAQDATSISDSFFKTLELGRVPISAISDSFGRIAVLANQLGISLSETQASLALFTRQGIKASQASTLIRSIMLKLIKPTKEMSGFLASIGFESGEAAVKTLGFANVMSIVEKESQKTGNALGNLGDLFSRVRAITGAAIFQGSGIQEFNRDLDAITNSAGSTAKAFDRIQESAGQVVDKGLNKITNALTEGFGKNILNTLADLEKSTKLFTRFAGALEFVGENAKILAVVITATLLPAIGGLTVSLYGSIAASTAASAGLFAVKAAAAAAIGPFGLIALAVGVIATAVVIAVNTVETELKRLNRLAAEAADQLEKRQKALTKRITAEATTRQRVVSNAITKGLQEETKTLVDQVQELSKTRNLLLEDLSSVQSAEEALIVSAFDAISDSISDAKSEVSKFKSEFDRLNKSLDTNKKAINDTILERALNKAVTGTAKRGVITEEVTTLQGEEGNGSLKEQETRLTRIIALLKKRQGLEVTRAGRGRALTDIIAAQRVLEDFQKTQAAVAKDREVTAGLAAKELEASKRRATALKVERKDLEAQLKAVTGVANKDKERLKILEAIKKNRSDLAVEGVDLSGAVSKEGKTSIELLTALSTNAKSSDSLTSELSKLTEVMKQSNLTAALSAQANRTSATAAANSTVVENALKNLNIGALTPAITRDVPSKRFGFGATQETFIPEERGLLESSARDAQKLSNLLASTNVNVIAAGLKEAQSSDARFARNFKIEELQALVRDGIDNDGDPTTARRKLTSEQTISAQNMIKALANYEAFLKTQLTAVNLPAIVAAAQDRNIKRANELNTVGEKIDVGSSKDTNAIEDANARQKLAEEPLLKAIEKATESSSNEVSSIDTNTGSLNRVTAGLGSLATAIDNRSSSLTVGDINITAPSGVALDKAGLTTLLREVLPRLQRQDEFFAARRPLRPNS